MNFICHCDLTDELHVVTETTCCEVCRSDGRMPLTPENVAQAFKFMQARITAEAPGHTDAEIVPSPQDWDDARAVAMRAVDRFRAMVPRPTAESGGTLSLLIAEFAFELACRAKKSARRTGRSGLMGKVTPSPNDRGR